jgi:hypothetical protein
MSCQQPRDVLVSEDLEFNEIVIHGVDAISRHGRGSKYLTAQQFEYKKHDMRIPFLK